MSFEIEKKTRKKRRWGRIYEYTSFERNLAVSDDFQKAYDIIKGIFDKKKRLVTAEKIAEETNLRVSSVKKVLKILLDEGAVKLAYEGKKLRVYQSV
ncbi:MAG: hypothetical protein ACFFDI_09100 [Promethearchaeota archaeon]